jgi:hypothetical protein
MARGLRADCSGERGGGEPQASVLEETPHDISAERMRRHARLALCVTTLELATPSSARTITLPRLVELLLLERSGGPSAQLSPAMHASQASSASLRVGRAATIAPTRLRNAAHWVIVAAVSSRARPARLGLLAVLGALVALVAGYFNDCFGGLGLSPGAPTRAVPAVEATKTAADTAGKVRVVVQGELCRLDSSTELRACDLVCADQVAGSTVEVEATAGAQRAVEALQACVKGRGAKVQVVSE